MNGTGSVTIGEGAVLQNSNTGSLAGGGVRMDTNDGNRLYLDGGSIKNCRSTGYGGGISLKLGVFTMRDGSITGCSGANGGAIRVDSTMYMMGGSITGNSATATGDGISMDANVQKLYFSGSCIVRNNTLSNGTLCNVQLGADKNTVINASGLESGAEIGIYTASGNIRTATALRVRNSALGQRRRKISTAS